MRHRIRWLQSKSVVCLLVGGLLALTLVGCAKTPNAGPPKSSSTAGPWIAPIQPSISQQVAQLFIGITSDARNRPGVNALDTFAAAFDWHKTPDKMNALLNAKVGYVGKVDGRVVMAASDGTNDIISITLREEFVPSDLLSAMRQVYTLKPRGEDTSDGERMEIYTMVDHGETVGVLMLTYGVVDATKGTGTMAYLSVAKARKELSSFKD